LPQHYDPARDREKMRLRKAAQRAMPILGRCERCRRRKARERHHYSAWDGEAFKNSIEALCRKCHKKAEREKPHAAPHD